jgi:hypothetical protein
MTIIAENYFSPESETAFFGSTQFKNFMDCEEATLAKIKGEYVEEKTTALLVGSYVDAHFEGTLDIFKAQHPEILKRDGELKSEYIHADYIINRIERDEMFMRYLNGGKQVIKTGHWLGVDWKIKIDSYHPEKAIIDLKIMKDFAPVWVDGQGKIPFIEAWGYDIQAAIYQAVTGGRLPFFIAAATKEKPEPDIAIMSIPQDNIDVAAAIIKAHIDRFADVKAGREAPTRCEKCNWCKRTKKLTRIVDYKEIGI